MRGNAAIQLWDFAGKRDSIAAVGVGIALGLEISAATDEGMEISAQVLPEAPIGAFSAPLTSQMNNALQSRRLKGSDESDLIGSLQSLLDRKHAQFVSSARRYWEKNFVGKDPSDACVSVRISHSRLPSPRPTLVHRLQTV